MPGHAPSAERIGFKMLSGSSTEPASVWFRVGNCNKSMEWNQVKTPITNINIPKLETLYIIILSHLPLQDVSSDWRNGISYSVVDPLWYSLSSWCKDSEVNSVGEML